MLQHHQDVSPYTQQLVRAWRTQDGQTCDAILVNEPVFLLRACNAKCSQSEAQPTMPKPPPALPLSSPTSTWECFCGHYYLTTQQYVQELSAKSKLEPAMSYQLLPCCCCQARISSSCSIPSSLLIMGMSLDHVHTGKHVLDCLWNRGRTTQQICSAGDSTTTSCLHIAGGQPSWSSGGEAKDDQISNFTVGWLLATRTPKAITQTFLVVPQEATSSNR